MGEAKNKPNIFEYDNYRMFLKDLYKSLKQTMPAFSYRYFSRMAGFRSPNFLHLVSEGKRNLTPMSIGKFALAFKLSKEESVFFRKLVLMNQASTVEEKRYYAEQVIYSNKFRKTHPLSQERYDYYTHWYYIPVRELVGTVGFVEDPQWIAKQLMPAISAAEAEKALATLENLGMIKRNEEGRLVQSENTISTGDEIVSASVAQFHREMIQKGMESIDRFGASVREVSALTLSISGSTAKQIKNLIRKFRQELLAIAGADKNAEQVFQLNFQLFPLSQMSVSEAEKI